MPLSQETVAAQRRLRAQIERTVSEQERNLVEAWVTAWDAVRDDLEAALLEQLVTGDRITRAQLLRSKRLANALAIVADQLQELSRQAGVRITGDLRGVLDAAGGAQASIIDSQLPRDVDLVALDAWSRVDARQVDAIVRRSTQQITSTLRPLSAETYGVVRRELIRGVASGSNPRQTARRMVRRAEKRFNGQLGLTRALVVARTETIDAHRAAAALAQAQHADVLAGWVWTATLSTRSCPACLAMHGREFRLNQTGPQGHQNCRCARLPKTKTWADLGITGVTEPADALSDAQAWFAGLSDAEQTAIMGAERLRLLRAGDASWDDLATLRPADGWRDSWAVTPVASLRRRVSAA